MWLDLAVVTHLYNRLRNHCIRNEKQPTKDRPVGEGMAYGETEPIFVNHLRQRLKITSNDVVFDFGSGIGNVVLQLVAQTGCRGIGVESHLETAKIGSCMKDSLMNDPTIRGPISEDTISAIYARLELHQGNALEMRQQLQEATVVFINNVSMAQNPNLMEQIRKVLQETLQDGARVIVFEPFVEGSRSGHGRVNTSIFAGERIEGRSGIDWVSWTSNPIPYYIYTVDRSGAQEEEEKEEEAFPSSSSQKTTPPSSQTTIKPMASSSKQSKPSRTGVNFLLITTIAKCYQCKNTGPTVYYDFNLENVDRITNPQNQREPYRFCSTKCAWYCLLALKNEKNPESIMHDPAARKQLFESSRLRLLTTPLLASSIWLDFNAQRKPYKAGKHIVDLRPYSKHKISKAERLAQWKSHKNTVVYFQDAEIMGSKSYRIGDRWVYEVDYRLAAHLYNAIIENMISKDTQQLLELIKSRGKTWRELHKTRGVLSFADIGLSPSDVRTVAHQSLDIAFIHTSGRPTQPLRWVNLVYSLLDATDVKPSASAIETTKTAEGCSRPGCRSQQNSQCLQFEFNVIPHQQGTYCSTDCAFLELVVPLLKEQRNPSGILLYELLEVDPHSNPIVIPLLTESESTLVQTRLRILNNNFNEFVSVKCGNSVNSIAPKSGAFPLFSSGWIMNSGTTPKHRIIVSNWFAKVYGIFYYRQFITKPNPSRILAFDYDLQLVFHLEYSNAAFNPFIAPGQSITKTTDEVHLRLLNNIPVSISVPITTEMEPEQTSEQETQSPTVITIDDDDEDEDEEVVVVQPLPTKTTKKPKATRAQKTRPPTPPSKTPSVSSASSASESSSTAVEPTRRGRGRPQKSLEERKADLKQLQGRREQMIHDLEAKKEHARVIANYLIMLHARKQSIMAQMI